MEKFDPVKLNWAGKDYVILPDRRMGAIARVEDVLTIHQLSDFLINKKTAPLGKLAMAFGSLLRWAGADVSDEEVYAGMFSGDDTAAKTAVETLYGIMAPPAGLTEAKGGKANPPKRRKAAAS